MPRVLCVISTLDSGPGESLLQSVSALRERFDFTICELLPGRAGHAQRGRALGATVTEVGLPGSSPTALGAVLRVAEDARPDLLHGFELDTNFHASIAARRLGAPMVAGFHGMESAFRRSRAPFLQWVLLRADHIVCVSAAIARRCSARAPWARRRLTVVPNGVDCSDFALGDHAPPRGTATVTCVANFHSSVKGHEHLLRAAALFEPEEVAIQLVGSGRLEPSMRARADQLGLGDRVRFEGWRADVAQVLAASDVFVLPSISEGIPHALLQAMASGVPVVASAVGGIPDVVEHGRSGLLVPPADPRALRDAVRSQLADDALYARLAAGGRRRVEDRFDATSAAAGMERVYGLALAA